MDEGSSLQLSAADCAKRNLVSRLTYFSTWSRSDTLFVLFEEERDCRMRDPMFDLHYMSVPTFHGVKFDSNHKSCKRQSRISPTQVVVLQGFTRDEIHRDFFVNAQYRGLAEEVQHSAVYM